MQLAAQLQKLECNWLLKRDAEMSHDHLNMCMTALILYFSSNSSFVLRVKFIVLECDVDMTKVVQQQPQEHTNTCHVLVHSIHHNCRVSITLVLCAL